MDFLTFTPSWDFILFTLICFFTLIGVIIGESKTIKGLLVAYPSFFVADFFSVFLPSLFPNISIALISNGEISNVLTISEQITSLYIYSGIKIFLFCVIWLVLFQFTFFEISAKNCKNSVGNLFLLGIISLSFALLFINIILLLLSGWSIVGFDTVHHVLSEMTSESFLALHFVQYNGLFFAVPAVILMFALLLHSEEKSLSESENTDS